MNNSGARPEPGPTETDTTTPNDPRVTPPPLDKSAWYRDMLRSGLRDRTKLVLLQMGIRADQDNLVRLHRHVVADALGLRVQRVAESLTEARDQGWLEVVRNGGYGRPTTWRITRGSLPQLAGTGGQLRGVTGRSTRTITTDAEGNWPVHPDDYDPDDDPQLAGPAGHSVREGTRATITGADAAGPDPNPDDDSPSLAGALDPGPAPPADVTDDDAPGDQPQEGYSDGCDYGDDCYHEEAS